jgi:hypothetical protein
VIAGELRTLGKVEGQLRRIAQAGQAARVVALPQRIIK